MAELLQETDIIEKLNNAPSVRGFFITASEIFEETVDALVQRIFRSDYLTVKAVINPLLESSGPLGDLSVRLKLLFGLGVLSDKIYSDIDAFITLKNQLNNDAYDYKFTDKKIISAVKKLNAVKKGIMPIEQIETSIADDPTDEFYQLQMDRYEQVIKSSLSLVIVELCQSLNIDSPFTTQYR
ncbi:MltR family transcriptional regulator [Vibrio viridaestus]|uniref:MltR family transcriptional regulator n=1 Tax=Vibrio viridaestus TaxID=2487322 RepID=A0A3N9TMH7_9VIBR|nr:MltR family transcriptional regulator [Vibrio viridaestus]RQW65053.1 MltR family transcriptional regulator [Vibrio viridaestus]